MSRPTPPSMSVPTKNSTLDRSRELTSDRTTGKRTLSSLNLGLRNDVLRTCVSLLRQGSPGYTWGTCVTTVTANVIVCLGPTTMIIVEGNWLDVKCPSDPERTKLGTLKSLDPREETGVFRAGSTNQWGTCPKIYKFVTWN